MSELVLQIDYGYRASNEATLDSTLSALQQDIGGQRRPWGARAGAIDLVTYLEFVVTFVVGATLGEALKNYFSALSGAQRAKTLGERHRAIVLQWLGDVQDAVTRLIASAKQRFREGLAAPKFNGKEQSIAIRVVLGVECFIVLNGPHVSEDALDRLPDAISKMLQFIGEFGPPDQSTVLQLCFDPVSREWRFLLAPSHQGFGRFVDRVVDLSTGQLITLRSRHEFIELLHVAEEDGLKFLVDPYWYPD
jgi:hypothetical protein